MTTSTDFTNCSELWQLFPANFCFCFFVSLYQPWTEISETSTSCTELLSSHAGVTSVSLNNRSEWWTGQGNDWTPKKRNNADISTLTIYHEAIFGLCWLSLTRPITFVASSSPDFGSLSAWSWALGPFAPSLPLTGRNWNDKISEIMQTEGRDREDRGNKEGKYLHWKKNCRKSTWTISQKAIFGLCWLSWTRTMTPTASSGPDSMPLVTCCWAVGPGPPFLPFAWLDRTWNEVKLEKGKLRKRQPGHLASWQSFVSVRSPRQVPMSPLQVRALILDPLPQDVEHTDHSPHSCHSLVIPPHSGWRHTLVTVAFPGQDPNLALQALALILAPLPHVVEHSDHAPHSCHWLALWHLTKRQSFVSEAFPWHDPSRPVQARALIWAPFPQEVEHWDHSLHLCHWGQGFFT